ncbi:MAG: thioredoxin domain-containing protein [Deltaproteobacteria bacterium]|nr:thioredoxin domain-containing protein [Deltaproteobacteria bacterium]
MVRYIIRIAVLLGSFLIGCFTGGNVCSADTESKRASNRLAHEKSPYLLQHAQNPVDWYPWGDEAFQKAKKEGKPIFLSIGYATCHWCHVMAHESFEDDEVADVLNKYFISIKVDREERPDVDKIYMHVCQALTGQGGWPLSVFMTPERKPFFAGTYFPKHGRLGLPGFLDVLNQIAHMWREDREQVLKSSEAITGAIQPGSETDRRENVVTQETLKKGYTQLSIAFDGTWGGFGSRPKFPTPHHLTFLLRWHKRTGDARALEMVEKTLDEMRKGGIFDQIGFGFHRYSVDEKWLVPHFEKMLYDQALLAMAYTEAYQATGKEQFAQVAKEVFAYVLRDMTSPDGGFYSAEDADSEGKEGLFYVWTPEEVKKHLGEETGDLFCRFYGITESGNFEDDLSIAYSRIPLEAFATKEGKDPTELKGVFEEARRKLLEVRNGRIHPLKDDKILTSWNGLMIAAFAKGYKVFGDQDYADAARRAAAFVLKNLRTAEGRLLRRFREGDAAYPAYLDDYAFLVWGLIELYEATFELSHLEEAIALNQAMIDIFWDEQGGGLYFTGKGNEPLITRSKDVYDGAIPSGNSVAALNLMRLSRMTGNSSLEDRAAKLTRAFSAQLKEQPIAYTQMLIALDFMVGPSREIVIAGDAGHKVTQAMIDVVHKKFLPNKVVLLRLGGNQGERLSALSPFLKDMASANKAPRAYVCEAYTCQAPIKDAAKLASTLE